MTSQATNGFSIKLALNSVKVLLRHIERARAMNSKIGPVDLSKNENDWEGLKEWQFSKWIPADFMSVVMTSFSNRLLHYHVIITLIWLLVEISKISMLFSHTCISHMPQPPIQFLSLHVQTFRAFWDYFLYIKSFWTEWWGNWNIDDDKYAKIQIFSYIRKLTKLFACFSCKLIIKNECSVYIHSLDFPLIIYVTKIGWFHISYFDQQQGQFRCSWS